MKALIFDMDGTIVDSMPFHHLARLVLLGKYGINLQFEEFDTFKYSSFSTMVQQYFEGQINSETIKGLNDEKQLIYRLLYEKHIREIKGFSRLLKVAKSEGYSIALATMGSFENINYVLDRLEVRDFFDVIVSGKNIKSGKPDPEIYLSVLKSFNIKPENAIVFEDTYDGVIAAGKAGLEVVGICTTNSKEQFETWGVKKSIYNFDEYLHQYML
jgi:beta-phosphoglucomutase